MARWRLTSKHYLPVPGTEWEYKEINDQGKQARKIYPVPLYLDPDDRSDWNSDEGIIVSDGVGAKPRDIIFTGPPGPDMAPLDEDAQAKTDRESPKWIHPIESVDTEGNDTSATTNILKELAAIMASQKPSGAIPAEDFLELKEMVAQQAAIISELTKKPERRA